MVYGVIILDKWFRCLESLIRALNSISNLAPLLRYTFDTTNDNKLSSVEPYNLFW